MKAVPLKVTMREDIDKWKLQGVPLDQAIKYLRSLQRKYSANAELEMRYDDLNQCIEMSIEYQRFETPAEAKARLARDQRKYEEAQRSEIELRDRLLAKYPLHAQPHMPPSDTPVSEVKRKGRPALKKRAD